MIELFLSFFGFWVSDNSYVDYSIYRVQDERDSWYNETEFMIYYTYEFPARKK